VDVSKSEDFLLIIRDDGTDAVRISPSALKVTQKKQAALEKAFVGCQVVGADGSGRVIRGLKVGGLADSRLPQWLAWLSLTGARTLAVDFAPPSRVQAEAFRAALVKFLTSQARADEWADSEESFQALVSRVKGARSVQDVFAAIRDANPTDSGLDVLV